MSNLTDLCQRDAKRIINSLRSGSSLLEGASYFSAGRDKISIAAVDNLRELEISDGASVRWLKGRYGQGKTHFFARLRDSAFKNNWVTSYVIISGKGQGAELHRFEEIYAAIVKNCIPPALAVDSSDENRYARNPGLTWILDRWVEKIRILAVGRISGDVPSMIVRDMIEHTIMNLQRKYGLNGSFKYALKQYAVASLDGDEEWKQLIIDWFYAENVHSQNNEIRSRLKKNGIITPVSRKNAKEMLRNLSIFIVSCGYSGFLLLFDEVENVLLQSQSARRSAYNLIRELIDNVDDRHGMIRTSFYLSGTPDLFDSETGLTEYEALAARVLLPINKQYLNPLASVIDFNLYPLSYDDFCQMSEKISRIHSIAGDWSPPNSVMEKINNRCKKLLEKNLELSPREWVRTVVEELDQAKQYL